MDYSLIYRIIFLFGFWNFFGFISTSGVSFCLFKSRIKSQRWSRIISQLPSGVAYLFCSAVLALNVSTVSEMSFSTIVTKPKSYSIHVLEQYVEKYQLIEDIFVFELSYFLTQLRSVTFSEHFDIFEFRRSITLVIFFSVGYCCKFLSITFFIGALSSLSLASKPFQSLISINQGKINAAVTFLRKIVLSLSLSVWAYFYIYLIPACCLYPVMLADTSNFGNRLYFNLFKVSFMLYYIAEIFNSSFVRWSLKYLENFKKVFFKFLNMTNDRCGDEKLRLNENAVQRKSPQEIKRQVELMQMVKCVVAIQKKLKRAKQNKEKLLSKGLQTEMN